MPRPNRFEDDDDREPPPRNSGHDSSLVTVLALAGALVFVLLIGCGVAGVIHGTKREAARRDAAEREAVIAIAVQEEQRRHADELENGERLPVMPRVVDGPAAISRRNFETAVLRKTKEQLIVDVGQPDDSTADVPQQPEKATLVVHAEWLYFRNRVRNEDTGKPYPVARVWIDKDGKAFRIDYP